MQAVPGPDALEEAGWPAAASVHSDASVHSGAASPSTVVPSAASPSPVVPSAVVPSAVVPSPVVPSAVVPPPPHLARGLALAELILARSQGAGQREGSRLPTERQLSVDLGVTRSSVRSALALLEAQGRISREVGRGTFLRGLPDSGQGAAREGLFSGGLAGSGQHGSGQHGSGAVSQDGVSSDGVSPDGAAKVSTADFAPADVMTIRRLFEPPAMVLVVAWATAADLEDIDRCLALGDRAATFEEFESCDLALHRSIMAASHSPLLRALYAAIEAARHGQVWGDLKRRSTSSERRSQYQADHRAIVGALRSRDSGGAVEAMRLHLARVQEHLNVSDPAAGLTWR
jgi:GntR family uxuAB operon transcriptional repressor